MRTEEEKQSNQLQATRRHVRKQLNKALLNENVDDIPKIQLTCGGSYSQFLNLSLENLPHIIERLQEYQAKKIENKKAIDNIIDNDNLNILGK